MSKRRRVKQDDQWGCLQLIGLAILFLAFLMVFPTGRAAFLWAHRDGYVRREIEMISSRDPGVVSYGRARARVVLTGEIVTLKPLDFPELVVGKTVQKAKFESGRRLEVWYNPEAVSYIGPLRGSDHRVLSMRSYPDRPRLKHFLSLTAFTVAIAAIGFALFRRRPAPAVQPGERKSREPDVNAGRRTD
jgi:hypothetical protein